MIHLLKLNDDNIKEICLNLNSNDLFNFFLTCNHINNLQTNYFWKQKICLDFSSSVCLYKPNNELYKEQYKHLSNPELKIKNKNLFNKRADIREWYSLCHGIPEKSDQCHYTHNFEMLKWMINNGLTPKDSYTLHSKICNSITKLEYCHENGLLKTIMWSACRWSKMKELKWLLKHGYKFDINDLVELAKRSDIEWELVINSLNQDNIKLYFDQNFEDSFNMDRVVRDIIYTKKFDISILHRIENFFNKKINYEQYKLKMCFNGNIKAII